MKISLTAVTSLVLEIKDEGHPFAEGRIQLYGYTLRSFWACHCQCGLNSVVYLAKSMS